MKFLDMADQYIPGYRYLSRRERYRFEHSEAGRQFLVAVKITLLELKNAKRSEPWWTSFFNTEAHYAPVKRLFLTNRKQLLEEIVQAEEYEEVVTQITVKILRATYPDFKLLTPAQQNLLAQAQYSQNLQTKIQTPDAEIITAMRDPNYPSSLARLRTVGIEDWQISFLEDPLTRSLKIAIADERAAKLALFLPLLNASFSSTATWLTTLRARHQIEMEKEKPDTAQVEKILLIELIFHYLQQQSAVHLPSEILYHFNLQQARTIAKKILLAFEHNQELAMAFWLEHYKDALSTYILGKLLLINGKKWVAFPTSQEQGFTHSLSSLWNNSGVVQTGSAFVGTLADTHAFIQATGFSTQNESSLLAFLDLVNYFRYATQIGENRQILISLLSPFWPLVEEYRSIGLYENNKLFKIVRIIMPMLVVVAVVLLVAVLLGPLAIPELVFMLVLIPTLILALAAATKYVTLKNDIYRTARQIYYGGLFETPEFQVNERMIRAFGNSEENAQIIRCFYIDELGRCEEREAFYQAQAALSTEEIDHRKNNIARLRTLYLEWYTIHSNQGVGFNEVPKIALDRLQEVGNKAVQNLVTALEDEGQKLKEVVEQMVGDLQTDFTSENDEIEEDGQLLAREVKPPPINHTQRLFKPLEKSLTHKARAEEVDVIVAALS